MLFLLKKILTFFVLPVPVSLLFLAAGIWCFWRRKSRRMTLWLLGIGAGILMLCSNSTFSNLLMRPLETTYASIPELVPGGQLPAQIRQAKYIVVLGAGHADAQELPATQRLSSAALARINEAVRLQRMLPEARLIVSGPGQAGRPTHAAMLEEAAVSLGVDRARIVRIETGRDTEDEAQISKNLVGDAEVVLVTSAWHMPRAAGLFRHYRVNFVASPTDYLSGPWERWQLEDLIVWNAENVERSTAAIHERVGQVWNWMRGRSAP